MAYTASEHLEGVTTTQKFSVSDFGSQSVLKFKRSTFPGVFLAPRWLCQRERMVVYCMNTERSKSFSNHKTNLFREEYAPKKGRQIDARRPSELRIDLSH